MNYCTYRNKFCYDLIKKQAYIYVFGVTEDVIRLRESLLSLVAECIYNTGEIILLCAFC